MKILSFIMMIFSITIFIGWVFWKQEFQYSLPTPVPANFIDVKIGDSVDLKICKGDFTLLHFFNFNCPCARFNMQEFESMVHKYKDKVQFFVVLQSEDEQDVDRFKRKYGLDVEVILDKKGIISDKCGIYATPQAVLLNKNSTIYFKGNYNTARFCTRKDTKFVEIAIDNLVANKPLPLFVQNLLTESYGCTLPSDEGEQKNQSAFSLF